MIGLGSSITSGVAEAKYSASFDGTDDRIDTNQNFTSTFNDSFSISFWMKPTDGQPSSSEYLFGAVDGSSNPDDACQLELLTDGKLKFSFEADTDTFVITTDNEIFSNGTVSSWTHVLIAMTKNASGNSSADFFINGVDVDNTVSNNMTVANHANFNSTKNLVIGARNERGTIQDFYDGGVDDFAIFNTALDGTDAAAIYNNGKIFNLNLNIGNYTNSSNLVAYYRMGNGFFDDKANGAIHNQVNPGLGNNLVVNGDFSISNTYGTTDSPWTRTTSGGATVVIDNGVTTFTDVGGDNGKISQSVTYTSGSAYKLSATARLISGATSREIRVRDTNSTTDGALTDTDRFSITTDKKYVVFYFLANNNSDAVVVDRRSSGTYTFTVDNVILRKLNTIPGITSGGVTFSSDTP